MRTTLQRLGCLMVALKICNVAGIAHAQTSVSEVDKLVKASQQAYQEKANLGDNPDAWQASVPSVKIVTNDDLNAANSVADNKKQKRVSSAYYAKEAKVNEIMQRYAKLRKQAYSSFDKTNHDAFLMWVDDMLHQHTESENSKQPTLPEYVKFVNTITNINNAEQAELKNPKEEYDKVEFKADEVCDAEKKIISNMFSEANRHVR